MDYSRRTAVFRYLGLCSNASFEIDGYTLKFYGNCFNHAFYDKGADGSRTTFSERRACRIGEIGRLVSSCVDVEEYEDTVHESIVFYIRGSDCAIVFKRTKKKRVLIFATMFPIPRKQKEKKISSGQWVHVKSLKAV